MRNTRAIARLLLLRAASLGFWREEAADRGGALRVSGCQLLHRAERGDSPPASSTRTRTVLVLVWSIGLQISIDQ